jgi:parvulin-like peptidyl-prolyl isomerase
MPVLLALILSAPPVAAGPEVDADAVVVSRGTAQLTFGEIDARLAEVPAERRAGVMDSPERIDTLLQQLLLVEQLADEAVAAGFASDPRLQGQSDLARKRMLAQYRLEQLREQAREGIDAEALARERYLSDRAAFAIPETRTLRHLLVSTANRSEDEARARIDALAKRLADGEALEALAREASDDAPTRANGGLIEGLRAGTTDARFDTALQALSAPGAVTSSPVRTDRGWHLIELVSINPPRQPSFEELRDHLVTQAGATHVERAVRAHTDRLNNLPIQADPARVASLRERYQAGTAAAAGGNAPAPASGGH